MRPILSTSVAVNQTPSKPRQKSKMSQAVIRRSGPHLLLTCAAMLGPVMVAHADTARLTTIHSFSGADGSNPSGLVKGIDGRFYGTTSGGGESGWGTIFSITAATPLSTIFSFSSSSVLGAASGPSDLSVGRDGNLYGVIYNGGNYGDGVLYKITPGGSPIPLYSFNHANGGDAHPLSAPTEGDDGNFYGSAENGGAFELGTIYRITPSDSLSSLYSYSNAQSTYPRSALVQASDGNFYGTTRSGGAFGAGSVFTMTPSGQLTTLYSFSGADGAAPMGKLVQASDGKLYGTTSGGGSAGHGTVFMMTPAGSLTSLYSFSGGRDGASPYANLIQASDGHFYGTTLYGGTNQAGTIFKVTSSGAFISLCAFSGTDGKMPLAGLVQGEDGYLYGTTLQGGAYGYGGPGAASSGYGTIFKLSTKPCPIAPTGLSASAGNGTVTLNWTAADGASSYNVYQGTQIANELPTPVKSGIVATSATIDGLSNGTAYYFTVAANYANDRSGPSNEAAATPVHPLPEAPSSLTARADVFGQIKLSWTASPDAQTYQVYQGLYPDGEQSIPVASGVSNTRTTIKGLGKFKTYYFKVAAVNVYGTSLPSNEASAKTR